MNLLEALTAILITTSIFAAIVLSLYFFFRARNQEHMALIEKGMHPKEPVRKKNGSSNALKTLKTGIFFIGIALGLFFGHLMAKFTIINGVISYFMMILLMGGIALIFAYYFEIKLRSSDN